jgi:hypothetical protein
MLLFPYGLWRGPLRSKFKVLNFNQNTVQPGDSNAMGVGINVK